MKLKKKDTDVDLAFTEYLWTVIIFAQAANIWTKAIEKSIKSSNITVSQFVALQALYFNKKPMSPTHISRLLPIEVHSVTPMIDKLYRSELVTRRRSKTSRRSVDVNITEKGKELLYELGPSINELFQSVFGKLSKNDRAELERIIRQISDATADYLGANKQHLEENARILAGMIVDKPKKSADL
ncbi:MAG: MarR family transcriptional regulator [Dehalococcoidia bacterium]|nr:MarR family transcriptional regulator [Dehalococcoidia bacterium]